MIKKILLISILLVVGCKNNPHWYKPNGRVFNHMPKGGSPGFELGWKHGCESGFATQFSTAIGMSFYQWKKDPDLVVENPDINKLRVKYAKELPINWDDPKIVKKNLHDYKAIFWSAHIYCRHSALGGHQMKGTNPSLPGSGRWHPEDHGIGDIYRLDGKGDMRWTLW